MPSPATIVLGYNSFTTTDGVELAYQSHGDQAKKPLILLHGFTGSSAVWGRNISALRENFWVIVPDLRGHGLSSRRPDGKDATVSRLGKDLKELVDWLGLNDKDHTDQDVARPSCIAGSLGCAITWSFTEQFGQNVFDKLIWVDQAPLQNYTQDGTWGPEHGNRSLNSSESLTNMLDTLSTNPDDVYKGTIDGCLAYIWDPIWGRQQFDSEAAYLKAQEDDTSFFLNIAKQGDPTWFGKLMSDHTALDWRGSIKKNFGAASDSSTDILVVASERSGCFPAAGPIWIVDAILEDKNKTNNAWDPYVHGVVVDFGGHWCYWEDAGKFNDLVLNTKQLPDSYSVSEMIRPVVTPGVTAVVLIQNGLDIEIPIIEAFPKNTIISGVSVIGSRTVGENSIAHIGSERVIMGPHFHEGLDRETQIQQATEFVAMYDSGGPGIVSLDLDMPKARWYKLLWNGTFNTLCALMKMDVGEVQSSKGRETLLVPMMRELMAIAKEDGVELPEAAIQKLAYGLPDDCPYRPSMLVDVEQGRLMEIEVILGNALKKAERYGVPAPKCSTVYELLKMEQWRIQQDLSGVVKAKPTKVDGTSLF
ncbi:hypothetical protein ACLOAV_009825 [Pseudogymnoascus australis]